MEKGRRGEIALALLKYQIAHEGIRLGPDTKRELGNTAKFTKISIDELKEFSKELIEETLAEILAS